MKTKKVPIAVAVALWPGGNHVLDIRAGAANATDPAIPLASELIHANLSSKEATYNVCVWHLSQN